MDEKNSCAECLNLGRAVYCMQCIRMNKGYKDMFRSSAPIVVPYQSKDSRNTSAQPEKR